MGKVEPTHVHGSLRSAFTLVELLVVIGIIMMLLAILLSVIRRVQEAANSAKCLSNLRQIGQGIHAYAIDHRGYLFPESYGVGSQRNWVEILVTGRYVSAPLQSAASGTSVGESVWQCRTGLNQAYRGGGNLFRRDEPAYLGFTRWWTICTPNFRYIDSWYALNASGGDYNDPDGDFRKAPFRSYPASVRVRRTASLIRQAES
jgi:type II secretory pathway pseudopilin PulG